MEFYVALDLVNECDALSLLINVTVSKFAAFSRSET